MKTLAIFLLIAVAVMSCSGELPGNPEEQHSLVKRRINCPPMAICQPATQPPSRLERSLDHAEEGAAVDGDLPTNPIVQTLRGYRQKRGSKPVPIIACNRKTGKCTRI